MIKAIIFDCFGVLVTSTLTAFYDRHNFTEAQRQEARDVDNAACRGYLSYEEELERFGEIAGVSAQTVKQELEQNPTNDVLFGYVSRSLVSKYKIGMLSNASDDWLDKLFTPEQQAFFDDIVLSFRVKMAKPDRRIFELSAANLGILPEECIFVDDSERFCTGALEVGMQVVQYKTFAQFEQDIRKLLD